MYRLSKGSVEQQFLRFCFTRFIIKDSFNWIAWNWHCKNIRISKSLPKSYHERLEELCSFEQITHPDLSQCTKHIRIDFRQTNLAFHKCSFAVLHRRNTLYVFPRFSHKTNESKMRSIKELKCQAVCTLPCMKPLEMNQMRRLIVFQDHLSI